MAPSRREPSSATASRSDSSELESLPDDPRLLRALQDYLAELERGAKPDRAAYFARHPDLAALMAQCFDGLEAVQAATGQPPRPTTSTTLRKPPPQPTEPAPGNPLGDFRVVREIGRGGMGVVYEAEQLSLGRRVALKVLPFAAAFDSRQLHRFKIEAQAAAHLHHTNIVPVHAVGCERGMHFYAMQLIEGESLATLIGQLRQQAGLPSQEEPPSALTRVPRACHETATAAGPAEAIQAVDFPTPAATCGEARNILTRSGLSATLSDGRSGRSREFFRAVARLMVQAAEALEYAHRQGVIHRDVKPANLLLDVSGTLWVTDFGLAQLHDGAGLTQTGDLLGTLRYMSPEQAAGRRAVLDQRSDIYSLGATFYELLTFEPLCPGRDREVLLHQILSHDPRPPRTLNRAIPPELETIVLKAVNKNPAERYATAREFAEDLDRFLENKPILARRPTLLERARKWSKRHPSVVWAGVVLLILSIVGLVLNNWMVSREEANTRAALQREQQKAEAAERRFRQAKRAVDLLIHMSETEVAGKPFMTGLRKKLLETALVYYQEFIEEEENDSAAHGELVAVQNRVKTILEDLSVLQGADRLFLLADAAVLDDLKLSQTQRERIAELSSGFDKQRLESFKGFGALSQQERHRRFLELARANEKAAAAILTPLQLNRLSQISLRCAGPMAFIDPTTTERLGLSAAQKEQAHQIERQSFVCWQKAEALPEEAERRQGQESAWKVATEEFERLLTPKQLLIWREMAGAPFQGAVRPGPPPRPFEGEAGPGPPPRRGPR